ncbi:AbrB/MazE/SpoVT family DNA-binding domain-containing protein [Halosegnis longus]|uniref:AbrB/MazE/SpoVT family DNA-binding domain-containing protein n=1 Tax=Halosegnis longus TaxID=2216012 RepID=UPI00096A6A6E|nr:MULTISPECIES: AbrB/MazE/SpoVT family DNA-binding domain-containing protein [Halobacteriales]
MSERERQTVGQHGQVTIPKPLRERFGLQIGDEVFIREEAGKPVIERSMSREKVAEGYRQRGEQTRDLTSELEGVSTEANERLGDSPES